MAICVSALSPAAAQEKMRFAVGPFQPTPSDIRKAYEPFLKHLAGQLGRDYELVVTNDWAGIATIDRTGLRRHVFAPHYHV